MVLKPSEIAPLSACLFAQILHEAGVPAGVFNLVNGDGPTVGAAILSIPDVAMVSRGPCACGWTQCRTRIFGSRSYVAMAVSMVWHDGEPRSSSQGISQPVGGRCGGESDHAVLNVPRSVHSSIE